MWREIISALICVILAIYLGVFSVENVKLSDLRNGLDSVTKNSILANHTKIDNPRCDNRGATMVQISGNYSNGYELALKTPHAMTHISPHWFDVELRMVEANEQMKMNIKVYEAGHTNETWMEAIRKANPDIKIVPEFRFRNFGKMEINAVLDDRFMVTQIGGVLFEYCRTTKVDGLVIDAHDLFFNLTSPQRVTMGLDAMERLGKYFQNRKLIVIGAVRPLEMYKNVEATGFQKMLQEDWSEPQCEILTSSFDYVLLQTNEDRQFESHIHDWQAWVHKNTQCFEHKRKVMLGVNFHGFEYDVANDKIDENEAKMIVDGNYFLDVLRAGGSKLAKHDEMIGLILTYKPSANSSGTTIIYPSLTSIEYRLTIAKKNRMSVAISNYGMGLNYFANLLDKKLQVAHEISHFQVLYKSFMRPLRHRTFMKF